MNMDVLINVVILFIVVVSLLKRVKEISQKGDEVKKVPEGPPDPLAETIKQAQQKVEMRKEMDRRSIGEVFSQPEPAPQEEKPLSREIPQAPPTLEDIFRRLSGEIQPEIQTPEPEPAAFEPPSPPEPLPEPPVPARKPRRITQKTTVRKSGLSFSGSDVVRGIIMSEVLGPPVSMRHERAI